MTRLWLGLVAIGLVTLIGLSVRAGWRAVVARQAVTGPPATVAAGYEAGDHFPGAALLYAETEAAAPAEGVTGTTALPALPVSTAAQQAAMLDDGGSTGVVPARPFAFGRASATDRGRAIQCLTAAVYYEAASEPDAGQQAVAQVVLNRVRHPAFPATVCGVVYQGSERAGCQFSFACDGALARPVSRSGWMRALRVAAGALGGHVYAPVGLATHYHTYAVTPAWNRSLVMTDLVGAHLFHRWKGYWGTAAAFRQGYAGGEPVPGAHAPVVPAAALPVVAVLPVTPATMVQPGYAESGRSKAPPVATDRLPPASAVLDKWKDSGTPLR